MGSPLFNDVRPTPGSTSIARSASPRVPGNSAKISPEIVRREGSRGGASTVATAENSSGSLLAALSFVSLVVGAVLLAAVAVVPAAVGVATGSGTVTGSDAVSAAGKT